MSELKRCLDDLEARIDENVEDNILEQWRDFCLSDKRDELFCPRRPPNPPKSKWPEYRINAALNDPQIMMTRELCISVSNVLQSGSGRTLGIRANYGCTIIPSLFGVEMFYMDDAHDTLPANHPLPDAADSVRRILDDGVPDLCGGQGAVVLETTRMYLEYLKDYPKVSRYVHLYVPDLQSPIDNCETLWGSGLFLALYDDPELVKDFLSLLTETYRAFLLEWLKCAGQSADEPLNCGWGWMQKGRIRLSEDSAVNLSPDDYRRFVLPYSTALIREFGGTVHYCGNGIHFLDQLLPTENLSGFHMGQAELNSMDLIAEYTLKHRRRIMNLDYRFARELCEKYPQLTPYISCC